MSWTSTVLSSAGSSALFYVRYVYEAVAAARGVALEALAGQVEENARTFFGWGSSHV